MDPAEGVDRALDRAQHAPADRVLPGEDTGDVAPERRREGDQGTPGAPSGGSGSGSVIGPAIRQSRTGSQSVTVVPRSLGSRLLLMTMPPPWAATMSVHEQWPDAGGAPRLWVGPEEPGPDARGDPGAVVLHGDVDHALRGVVGGADADVAPRHDAVAPPHVAEGVADHRAQRPRDLESASTDADKVASSGRSSCARRAPSRLASPAAPARGGGGRRRGAPRRAGCEDALHGDEGEQKAPPGAAGPTRTRRSSVPARGWPRSRTSLCAAALTPSGSPAHSSTRRATQLAGAPPSTASTVPSRLNRRSQSVPSMLGLPAPREGAPAPVAGKVPARPHAAQKTGAWAAGCSDVAATVP